MRKLLLLFSICCMLATSLSATTDPLWLRYPSISPDGTVVAFSYGGDIYTVSSGGGEATLITSNGSYDTAPIWSPDGKTIAFASDRYGNFDIFTVDAKGGAPKRLTFYSGSEKPSSFTPDGTGILFSAHIRDSKDNVMFPSTALSELYLVSIDGGQETQILSTPAECASYNSDKSLIIYQDKKGYEDPMRKHHKSSITRDIRMFDVTTGKHKIVTSFEGEDREPIFSPDGIGFYYLSEKSGSLNVNYNNLESSVAVTSFTKHPVRSLSISDNSKLCYTYDGKIYTQNRGEEPAALAVEIRADITEEKVTFKQFSRGASEISISPEGDEIAFIIRGEVFVTSVEYGTTKRITNTPEQERSVSFSPDGKSLLYASERDGSWNLYQTTVVREDEKLFANSTLLKEEALLVTPEECFQPSYSPDGKEVAFLEERTTLRVINLKSKAVRTVLDGKWSYSYSDGDQYYQWSPDSKWFMVDIYPHTIFMTDIAVVSASGDQDIKNVTETGYNASNGKWSIDGSAMIYFTDKQGYRSHGSWGAESDVYAMFFTSEAYDKFKLSKEEKELAKKSEEKEKDKGDDSSEEESKVSEVKIEWDGLRDRQIRLTINSSNLSDAMLTPDGEKLYYLSRFESGYDLWVHNFSEGSTKKVLKLKGGGGAMQFDKGAKNLFLMSGSSIIKVDTKSDKRKDISYSADFYLNRPAERAYIFEHAWRQVQKKFYDVEIHGVEWSFYKDSYAKFLPHINNNYDFAEMLSEMLGELNGSHTGARYRPSGSGDVTANLGAYFDWEYEGDGLKVEEAIEKGPLSKSDSKIKAGVIIEKIDGVKLVKSQSFYPLLNHKVGKRVLISLYDPTTSERWDQVVKPISNGAFSSLEYKRWVKQREIECEKLSGGKVGYVHIKGMDSDSFREVYSNLLGKYGTKEAVVVDTRFNGGGWLHDDLVTLLGGERYADFTPREQFLGSEPAFKWKGKSAVLMGEGNYSDACGFPYAYKTLGIGSLVGMPVPGTMTAVWWESQIDPSIVFGIPQVGIKDLNGRYIENNQIEPDLKVANEYDVVVKGNDTQLKATVDLLLRQIEK